MQTRSWATIVPPHAGVLRTDSEPPCGGASNTRAQQRRQGTSLRGQARVSGQGWFHQSFIKSLDRIHHRASTVLDTRALSMSATSQSDNYPVTMYGRVLNLQHQPRGEQPLYIPYGQPACQMGQSRLQISSCGTPMQVCQGNS